MEVDIQQVKQRFGIIGNASKLQQAIRTAVQVAPTDVSVLITGESGVGKEFFPQIIHNYSIRKHKKYIAINCGAIPEGTIDSELFGHRKGSFTGALADRKGYFEEANEGTIFLDEVGELPMSTQARLLRVLENGEFIPVGSSEPIKSNVRLVAATNVNMVEAIRAGRFREDLYFRLNTVPIMVPALRERGDDIALLFRFFASLYAQQYNVPPLSINEQAKQILLTYRWPGNIRELRNITERMSILEQQREVTAEVLKNYLSEAGLRDLHPVIATAPMASSQDRHSFANEREILYQVLFDLKREVGELKKQVDELHLHGVANEGNTYNMESAKHNVDESSLPLLPQSYPLSTAEEHNTVDYDEIVEEQSSFQPTLLQEIEPLDQIEQKIITQALQLQQHGYTRVQIAEKLGISTRTLSRKIKEYGLE